MHIICPMRYGRGLPTVPSGAILNKTIIVHGLRRSGLIHEITHFSVQKDGDV